MEAPREERPHVSAAQTETRSPNGDRLSLDDLNEVPMRVEVLLGAALMTVRDVLNLKEGAVVPLRKLAGEMSDVYVNGMSLARGEIVVIGDNLSVRIAEVTGAQTEHPGESA